MTYQTRLIISTASAAISGLIAGGYNLAFAAEQPLTATNTATAIDNPGISWDTLGIIAMVVTILTAIGFAMIKPANDDTEEGTAHTAAH